MAKESVKAGWLITLGAQSFPVGLFTLGQVGRAFEHLDQALLPLSQGGLQGCRQLIAIALERQLCAQEISDGQSDDQVALLAYERVGAFEGTPEQIVAAVTTIAHASGLIRLGEPQAGMATVAGSA
ncbi:MAG: hypothetical protein PW843_24470 [Azospirillaceae bacterium]|nr:hypothetical protein [Azospirillaceae bacterium]